MAVTVSVASSTTPLITSISWLRALFGCSASRFSFGEARPIAIILQQHKSKMPAVPNIIFLTRDIFSSEKRLWTEIVARWDYNVSDVKPLSTSAKAL